jgi:hypothetical protein
MCHRFEWRDANAPGQQQAVLGRRRQRKVVARRADLDQLPHPCVVGERARTAPSGGIAQNTNDVSVCFLWVVAQAVLTHQPRTDVHIDVRACAEGGQCMPQGVNQLKGVNIGGFPADLLDAQLQRGRTREVSRGHAW